jgi:hypothetical protein
MQIKRGGLTADVNDDHATAASSAAHFPDGQKQPKQ